MNLRKTLAWVSVVVWGALYLHMGTFHAGHDLSSNGPLHHPASSTLAGHHHPDGPVAPMDGRQGDAVHEHGAGIFLPRESAPANALASHAVANGASETPDLPATNDTIRIESASRRYDRPLRLYLQHLALLI